MTLHHLLPVLDAMPEIQETVDQLTARSGVVRLTDFAPAARAAITSAVIARWHGPVLIVTSRATTATDFVSAVSQYSAHDRIPVAWPSLDALPFEQLPQDHEAASQRVAMLTALASWNKKQPGPVVVTPVHGLLQIVMPPADLTAHSLRISLGDRIDRGKLLTWATAHGYQQAPLVQEPGSIAHRGSIIDIFPPGERLPIRIDLFGDEVESIRRFDPGSQRSTESLKRFLVLPPSELALWRLPDAARQMARLDQSTLRPEVRDEWRRMLEQAGEGHAPASVDLFAPYLNGSAPLATLADYFPPSTLVILDDPDAVALATRQVNTQASELRETFEVNGELPRGLETPIVRWEDARDRLTAAAWLELSSAADEQQSGVSLPIADAPRFMNRFDDLAEAIRANLADHWRVVIASSQVDRLTEVFEERGIFPLRDKRQPGFEPPPPAPGALEIRDAYAPGGWSAPDVRLLVLTDLEVFGFQKSIRRLGRAVAGEAALLPSLTPGEYVVHIDHGIARFNGFVRFESNDVEREYLLLEYAKGDKLYVPVDQSDRVTRYAGGGVDPTPTKLGSGEWVQVKRKARRAVRDMAFELVQLYATRSTIKRPPYPPDTTWDRELAESFPYTETPDQMRAIEAVAADLESDEPMDRLVCGDVGFGKTEVALRAAFKAVNSGRQVAFLAPTTVLALQHYTTFKERLAAFPARIEMLSRLRNKAEQKEVLNGLAEGSVDIVIGTHRLVQRDVQFKNLGLLIVDEEQRFGVRQKEALKQLRTEIDVMTMSATPIPRTLHMALAGVRDISTIDTPPKSRLPIRTFVSESSDHLIREVLLRELDRGGQVYVVHNRVHDIDRLTHKLRTLVPEARFGIGHGQMDEQVLEEVILGFVRHEFDVLVSTTIIESGIDIPNVNTIIIDNADTLGLTQLYQLRGRVGRSVQRAYAYLLYRPHKALSEEAYERLEAIQEATELGAGLRVAMRDLEIRGAGNMLGAEQSGHIASIGYELYIRLLSQAVEEIRNGKPTEEPLPVTLDLPLTAIIPADYIPDAELRLSMYRRIAALTTAGELGEMRDELEDRFGPIPDEVEHLFALISLRQRAIVLGIDSLVEREREIVLRPVETRALDRASLARLGMAVRITPGTVRLRLADLTVPWQTAIDLVLSAIEAAQPGRSQRLAATGD